MPGPAGQQAAADHFTVFQDMVLVGVKKCPGLGFMMDRVQGVKIKARDVHYPSGRHFLEPLAKIENVFPLLHSMSDNLQHVSLIEETLQRTFFCRFAGIFC